MTPWTAAYQAPLSMEFSRQECWSGVPSPSPVKSEKKVLKVGQFGKGQCVPIVAARAPWTEPEAGLIPEGWPGLKSPSLDSDAASCPGSAGSSAWRVDLLNHLSPLLELWASQLPHLQTENDDSICFAGWLRPSAELTLKTHLEWYLRKVGMV